MLLLLVVRICRHYVEATHLACRLEADRTAKVTRSPEVVCLFASHDALHERFRRQALWAGIQMDTSTQFARPAIVPIRREWR
jgi:hypothetical protein